MLTTGHRRRAAQLTAALALGISTAAAIAQPAGIDPQAEKLLKASMTYLAAQKQLSVDSRSTIEVVLKTGQKLEFDTAASLTMQRPNRLRAERRGEIVDQIFFYDGKSLTLYNPGQRFYATVAAPGTLEAMLDYARDSLDVVAPAGDLLYGNAFDILMDGVTSGFVVGKGIVEGVACTHLAFRGADVDWQIWIQEGRQPLPRKYVITSRDIPGSPEFVVVMSKWNLAPKLAGQMFEFAPPKDATKVDFLPRGQVTPQSR